MHNVHGKTATEAGYSDQNGHWQKRIRYIYTIQPLQIKDNYVQI
jgi:hypothetical protein